MTKLRFNRGKKAAAWERSDEIIRAYQAGDSQTEIAHLFDCDHSTVRRILHANNIPVIRGTRTGSRNRRSSDYSSPPYPAHQLVDNASCPRCNTRVSIGCRHNRVALSMGAWA